MDLFFMKLGVTRSQDSVYQELNSLSFRNFLRCLGRQCGCQVLWFICGFITKCISRREVAGPPEEMLDPRRKLLDPGREVLDPI